MNTAAQDHQPGGLRVSDSDRDRAVAELSEHFQAGRITTDELEERTGRALRARTAGDLAELFTDLPGPAQIPASAPPARSGGTPVIPLVVVAVLVLGGFISGHSVVVVLVPVLIALIIIRRIVDGGRRDTRDRREPRDRRRYRGDRW